MAGFGGDFGDAVSAETFGGEDPQEVMRRALLRGLPVGRPAAVVGGLVPGALPGELLDSQRRDLPNSQFRTQDAGEPNARGFGEMPPWQGRPAAARGAVAAAEGPRTPTEWRAAGRPAMADFEQAIQSPAPAPHEPARLPGWKNALGTAATVAADIFAPRLAPLAELATNRGRQARADEAYEGELARRQQQIAQAGELARIETAAQPAAQRQAPYEFRSIEGHLWSLDPATGKRVEDLGPAGTQARLHSVETLPDGSRYAIFEDGSTKELSIRGAPTPPRGAAATAAGLDDKYLGIETQLAVNPGAVSPADRAWAAAYERSRSLGRRAAGGAAGAAAEAGGRPATPAQRTAIERTKNARLDALENEYRASERAAAAANARSGARPGDPDYAAAMGADELRRRKQNVQNDYEAELAQFGGAPIEHYEYPAAGVRPEAGAQAPPAGARTQVSPAERRRYSVGDVVRYHGQEHRVLGVRRDGSLELDPTPLPR